MTTTTNTSLHLKGTVEYPMAQRMADTIKQHGLAWSVRYYSKRMPIKEARLLLVGAYCQAAI